MKSIHVLFSILTGMILLTTAAVFPQPNLPFSDGATTPYIYDAETGNGTHLPLVREGLDPRPRSVETLVIIMVEFRDESFDAGHTPDYFRQLFFGRNSGDKSVHRFYFENSYGRTRLDGAVYGPFYLDVPMATYGANDNLTYRLIGDALRAADPTVDFEAYGNGQGNIAHPIVIHAGIGQEEDPENTDLLWSLRWGNDLNQGTYDGQDADWGIILAESSPVGVAAHELGHDFGLIDLYDFDTGDDTRWDYNNYPVVSWCIMASGSWAKHRQPGDTPTHFCGYNKMKLGWLNPVVVAGGQEVNINAQEVTYHNALFKIPLAVYDLPVGEGTIRAEEYFLLENRYPQAAGIQFDRYGVDGQPLDTGIIITHVDERQIHPQRQELWNSSESPTHPSLPHYALWIEDPGMEAIQDHRVNSQRKLDAAYALEDGQFFVDDVLPANGNLLFPNTRTNDGDPTGVSIRILTPSAETMAVRFFGGDDLPPELTVALLPNAAFPDQISIGMVANEPLNPLPLFSAHVRVNDGDVVPLRLIDDQRAFGHVQVMDGMSYLQVSAYDLARNKTTIERVLASFRVTPHQAQVLYSPDQQLHIDLPPDAILNPQRWIVTSLPEPGPPYNMDSWVLQSEVYQVITTDPVLKKPVQLRFTAALQPDHATILYHTAGGWQPLVTWGDGNQFTAEITGWGSGLFALGVSSGNHSDAPAAVRMYPSVPNPFNARTAIRYTLPRSLQVDFRIYNLRGQVVRTLVTGIQPAGDHTLVWDGRDDRDLAVESGVYYARLRVVNRSDYGIPLVLMK
ncbi:MAG: M6 family metalloprotease domain-containing protein [Gemmatimonadetes bacterium]|nr:MAG: M6 family metalloprotease domain-containing protein [Gemmatimonadota bacterium]